MEFQDKVVIVTGGSKGIGEATAWAFAEQGAAVAIVDTDRGSGEELSRKMRDKGYQALFVETDITKEAQVQSMIQKVLDEWGRLDVLVNNAGIYLQGDVEQTSLEQWQRVLDVNITGMFLCTKYAIPALLKNGGVVVNVASEAGLVGIKGQVVYNVSKGAVIAFTRSCAVDYASKGVRFNCVCPGTTDTPLVREAVNRSPDPAAARRHLEEIRPLNRLGKPEEIAAAIVALASERLGYATGAVFSIDGGYTAQ
ncbi:MAG: SDR family oxidoreductase [Anaerolineales bacterium]|nr:SDR family oxidoreductase [Anaerolineales bacterium]MDW8162192.1 SDR family NAD(P)-dependent oxidoreductase [Anaerolineales bacterium]